MQRSILIIDDTKIARQQIISFLATTPLFQRHHEAAGAIEGLRLLLEEPVDVVLCDLEMPEIDGLKFLGMLKAREDLRDIPVIMLTGRESQEAKIRSLEQGASDYVTKPFDSGELLARIKVQLKIKSLQDSLKESNRRLTELSNTDALTGLWNRRYLMETLERELARCRRAGSPLSLIMADIDHFKRINDTWGHLQGDEILKRVSELLRQHVRPYDIAARFGGEEFALVLPGSTENEAVPAAERIRLAAAGLSFPEPFADLRLTISLGVSTYLHEAARTVDDLLRNADAALYQAKKKGRNRVAVVSNPLSPPPFS